MKKSISAILLAAVLTISLSSCGEKSAHDHHKEIYKRYYNMQSFSATAEISYPHSQAETRFLVTQHFKAPKNFALTVIEPQSFSGSGYSFKDGKLFVKSGMGQFEALDPKTSETRNAIDISAFFEEYYKSEETFLETEKSISGNETVLSCYLQGRDKDNFFQKLWIDNKTYLPLKLETYNAEDKAVVTVIYKEFTRNCEIDDANFN